jgi:hypothetical protein
MPKTKKTARALFEELAAWTWSLLWQARKVPMTIGEETITDILLLQIKSAVLEGHTYILLAGKTPKKLEALYGTDWEWWIGNNTTGWIRYAIQAKVLDAKDTYAGLPQKVKSGARQVDLLEAYAAKVGAIPIYCLYNPASAPAGAGHWHCCTADGKFEQLGCSVTSSAVAQKAIRTYGGKKFGRIHSNSASVPWRCLVACGRYRTSMGHPLASNIVGKQYWYKKPPRFTMRSSPNMDKDTNEVSYYPDTPLPRAIMITEAPMPIDPGEHRTDDRRRSGKG